MNDKHMLYGMIGLCVLVGYGFVPSHRATATATHDDEKVLIHVNDIDFPISKANMEDIWGKCRIVDKARYEASYKMNTASVWQDRLDAQDVLRRSHEVWDVEADKMCAAISTYKIQH